MLGEPAGDLHPVHGREQAEGVGLGREAAGVELEEALQAGAGAEGAGGGDFVLGEGLGLDGRLEVGLDGLGGDVGVVVLVLGGGEGAEEAPQGVLPGPVDGIARGELVDVGGELVDHLGLDEPELVVLGLVLRSVEALDQGQAALLGRGPPRVGALGVAPQPAEPAARRVEDERVRLRRPLAGLRRPGIAPGRDGGRRGVAGLRRGRRRPARGGEGEEGQNGDRSDGRSRHGCNVPPTEVRAGGGFRVTSRRLAHPGTPGVPSSFR